jgi:Tol biopolymer transport system component
MRPQRRVPGRIVFATDRGGNVDNTEIYSIRADGRGRRALTRNLGADGGAAWSPDGRRIAFWSERFEGRQRVRGLYVMRADGSGGRRLSPRYLVVAEDAGRRSGVLSRRKPYSVRSRTKPAHRHLGRAHGRIPAAAAGEGA